MSDSFESQKLYRLLEELLENIKNKEENKKLKDLVKHTETEIEGIIKKNHEESERVKKIIEKFQSLDQLDSNEAKAIPLLLQCIYNLESEITKIKDILLQISVENLTNSKKLDRWLKKNRALEEMQEEYKERIKKLKTEEVFCKGRLVSLKRLQEVLLCESLHLKEQPENLIRLVLSNKI